MPKQTLILRRKEDLEQAARIIINGGLVVFPTETVYGLGANALDSTAVAKIFEAKGRPQDNPLIVHFADTALLKKFGFHLSVLEKRIFDSFSPGPLTLILDRPENFPSVVSGGLDTLAVRIPAHPVALEFFRLCQCPVAAPSANLSGKPSPTDFEMAFAAMNDRADAIIDGGACEVGLESTVIRVRNDTNIQVLRPGGISPVELQSVAGKNVQIISEKKLREGIHSPGTRYPHYKPRADVALFSESLEIQPSVRRATLLLIKNQSHMVSELKEKYPDTDFNVVVFKNTDAYAKEFYRVLTDADKTDLIICQKVEEKGIGIALMNRMRRAAGVE